MRKLLLTFFLILYTIHPIIAQGPGCPSINAGTDQTLPCNVTCTTLNASLFQTGATTNYTVSSIAYNPPSPSTAWTNTFVNIDDVWSGVINLPFTFCYYGAAYNQLVVGANGAISFNTGYANGFCPWSFTASVPSPALPLNSIFGAFHDLDPSDCGTIRFAISGTFPCRTFMFDFNAVCHFDCSNRQTTQRIVLYETSNVIEIYLGNKPVCGGWNGGRAVVGIQNAAGDQGIVAPGRQTGSWTASNEAWRFTPSGAPNYQIQWFSSATPGLIGTGTSVNVCPTNQFTTYSAILTYTNCNNAQVVVSDYVSVTMNSPAQPPIFNNNPCAGQTLTLSTNTVSGATYYWSGPGGWTSTAQNPTRPSATTAMGGTYTLYVVVGGCTSSVASKVVTVLNNSIQPNFSSNTPICSGTTLIFDGPTFPGASYFWSGPGGWSSNVEDPTRANATAAMSGVYSLYVVSGGCTSATATQNVVVNTSPAAPVISSNSPVCTQNTINLFAPTVAGATYLWTGPGGWASSIEDPTRPNANSSMSGTYSLTLVVAGCTSATSNTNIIVSGPPIPAVNIPQQVCAGTTVNFASGTYPGATYVWTGPNGFTASTENPSIANVTTSATGTYNLYLVQSGCTSITASSYMEVISTTAPTLGATTICAGNTLSLTSNTVANATYFWSGPNGFTSSLEDPSIPNATTAESGNYSMYYVLDGCTSATSTVLATVNPVPSVNSVPNQSFCNGASTSTISFNGPVGGTTYNWTNSNTAIGLTANGNNSIPAFTATNAGNTPLTSTITVTPVAASCTGLSTTFAITVNPTPTVAPIANVNLCTGSTSAVVNPTGTVSGTTFSWTNSNTNIGLAASGNGPIPAFTATNSTTSPISATITVTPTANGCTGTPTTYTITVNPAPTVNPIANQTICRGATSAAVTPTSATGGATFSWTNSNPAIGLSSSGNGTIGTFTGTNTGSTPITGTITYTATAGGCSGPPTSFTITVNPRPTVDPISTQTYCPGATTTPIVITGPVAGTNFSWTSSNAAIGLATSGTGDIPSFVATNPGSGAISSTVIVTPSANGCTGTTGAFFINVSPTATVNPIANQTVCNGAATTAVNPTGSVGGTSYTWTNNTPSIGLPASGNGPIPAFTAVNSTSSPIVATVTVTPSANACNGTPRTFTITVNPSPAANSIANQVFCHNSTVPAILFTSPVAGTSFTWTNSNTAIGLAASGNGNLPSFMATNPSNSPISSTITVTPSASSCGGASTTFTITVNPIPTVNNVTSQTLCNGASTAAISFASPTAGTTFSWTNSNPSIGLAASGNGDINSFNAVNAGTTAVTSTITVTPTANSCTGPDNTFTITVNPTPTVDPIASQTVCNAAATSAISFNGGVAGTTYNWTNNDASTGLAASGSGDIASFNAVNTGNVPVTSTVTVTPTVNGCTGTAQNFTILVNPTPTVNLVNNQTVCDGASTTPVTFNGPVAGTTFSWTNNTTSIGLAASGSGDIPTFNATNSSSSVVTANVTVTPSANGCTGPNQTFSIAVNPTPTVNSINDQTVCNGTNTSPISFTGSVANSTFNWVNDNTATGLAANGNGDINAFAATNNTNAPIVSNITVTPTANGCAGAAQSFTITVNPTPTVDPVNNQTVCNGASVTAINFTGTVANTTFAWTNTDASIGLPSSGNGNITSFNAVNNGNTPITATLTVTPSASSLSCVGPAGTFTITVNPTPAVGPVADQTICNGASTTAVNFNGTVNNTTFSWTNSNTTIGLAANGSGNITAFTGINNGTAALTANIAVTPSANNCTGNPQGFTITVNPTPTVDNINNQTYCNGTAVPAISITGPVAGTTFGWTNSNTSIGLAASGSGSPIPSYTATNAGNVALTSTITITPTANNCVGTPSSYTVTVNPTPTTDALTDQNICNGDASTSVTLTGSVGNTTFNWTNNNTTTGLTASGSNSVPSFTGTNSSNSPITSTVTVTPTANNCTGASTDFDITVNPTHTGTPVNASICDGDTYTFGGQSFTSSGSYPVVFQNIYNCDSTVTLNLTVIPAAGPPPPSTTFNTGNNGAGGTLPGGSPDNNWTVSASGINGPYVPATVMTTLPGNYYNSPWPDCQWITHNADGSHNVDQSFFYRVDFDLACANECGQSYTDPNVFCLNLDFFADNSVYEIYVNGVPQSAQIGNMPVPNPYYATGFNAAGMVSVSFCDGWQPGNNTVIVQIVSGPGYAGFLGQTSVNPPPPISDTVTATICDNQTLSFGTQTLSTAGTYLETFTSVMGCDSAVTMILSVNPTYTGTENGVICAGDTYTFGGQAYTTAGSYPVTFQTVNGCDSTVTLNLTVNPTYTSNWPQTICQGASVTFGGNTYSSTGDYPVTFQTVNGCDSTVTLQLTVNANPPAVIAPQADQCFNGHSFNFALQPPAGAGATYNWTFTGANTASSTAAAPNGITYPTAGTYTVDVEVTENSCISNGTLTVNVLAQPNAQFNADPPSGCVPVTVEFTNITTGGGNISWTFAGGNIGTGTTSPITVTYNTPGLYDVSLTVTYPNGCSDTETVPNLINVQAIPTAGFTVTPEEVDMGNPVATFIDGSSGASNVYYFVNNGTGVIGPNAEYTFTEEGDYEVMQVVTSSGGCSDTAYGYLVVIGNTEVFIPNTFTPNADPLNPYFKVVGTGFYEFSMMIFNRWGEMIFSSQNANDGWDGTYGGKPVPMDVYVYKVQLRDYNKKLRTYIGNVNVLR